jgi:hypothetical protein
MECPPDRPFKELYQPRRRIGAKSMHSGLLVTTLVVGRFIPVGQLRLKEPLKLRTYQKIASWGTRQLGN